MPGEQGQKEGRVCQGTASLLDQYGDLGSLFGKLSPYVEDFFPVASYLVQVGGG